MRLINGSSKENYPSLSLPDEEDFMLFAVKASEPFKFIGKVLCNEKVCRMCECDNSRCICEC